MLRNSTPPHTVFHKNCHLTHRLNSHVSISPKRMNETLTWNRSPYKSLTHFMHSLKAGNKTPTTQWFFNIESRGLGCFFRITSTLNNHVIECFLLWITDKFLWLNFHALVTVIQPPPAVKRFMWHQGKYHWYRRLPKLLQTHSKSLYIIYQWHCYYVLDIHLLIFL